MFRILNLESTSMIDLIRVNKAIEINERWTPLVGSSKYFVFYFEGYFHFRIILGQYDYYVTFKTITSNGKSQHTETENARKSIAYILHYNRVYHEKAISLDVNKTSKKPHSLPCGCNENLWYYLLTRYTTSSRYFVFKCIFFQRNNAEEQVWPKTKLDFIFVSDFL